MNKKQNRVPLRELNLTDRFLFDEVMEDAQIHQDVLSIILGREILLLSSSQTERELRISPNIRAIRLDVVTMDEDKVLYNTEMQGKRKNDLAKRSRYYQALVDTNLLEPGIPNYNLLNTTYIILIATFDIFGYGKYKYTFEATCEEVPECKLNDKAVRIFLNTKGRNDDEVSEELIEFLHYIEESTDEVARESNSERIRRIHERVRKVKMSEEVGVKYMQAWEEKYYEREEGREEGARDKLKELIQKKLARGKSVEEIADALEESAEVIEELMKELE
ncbi:MAG: Rpn family recombination-promoting nuclease/putative transposase [Eubacteriales bacterium]|nr:Rpn family recombination-promoting nuclease/putative transposase [Eubacteriales bacterium]